MNDQEARERGYWDKPVGMDQRASMERSPFTPGGILFLPASNARCVMRERGHAPKTPGQTQGFLMRCLWRIQEGNEVKYCCVGAFPKHGHWGYTTHPTPTSVP